MHRSRWLSTPWIGLGFGIVTALAATAGSAPATARNLTPGIIGTDDRVPVDVTRAPWSAVGQVNVSRYRNRTSCTGTLIAPDRVLTAAHCLLDPAKGEVFPLKSIHFLTGVFGSRFAEHAQARCVVLPEGLNRAPPPPGERRAPGTRPLAWFVNDFAVIILDKPLATPPIAIAGEKPSPPTADLVHAAFAGDRRQRLTAHRGCGVKGTRDGLWLTDCDTHHAGSGGPVLIAEADEIRLAAVMVGVLSGRASVAVPAARWKDTVLEGPCPAS